jgi:dTDP-4-dehydrorhamnose 3,5-epimerase
MGIRIQPTAIPEVLLIDVERFGDDRGFFMETYHRGRYVEAGLTAAFLQDNHSRSRGGILRGLHLQDRTAPMGKLMRCSAGAILDVAIDLRTSSATFGQWVAEELSEENNRQFYVPPGFGHGFLTLSDSADVQYKCTNVYAPESEITLAWNDPDIGIEWPTSTPSMSGRDAGGISLSEYRALPATRVFD